MLERISSPIFWKKFYRYSIISWVELISESSLVWIFLRVFKYKLNSINTIRSIPVVSFILSEFWLLVVLKELVHCIYIVDVILAQLFVVYFFILLMLGVSAVLSQHSVPILIIFIFFGVVLLEA